MNDNGKENQEPNPSIIEMRIIAEAGKPVQVSFPFLIDKVATYGFLKVAEKTLDVHYAQQQSLIVKPKHGMFDFARGLNKK